MTRYFICQNRKGDVTPQQWVKCQNIALCCPLNCPFSLLMNHCIWTNLPSFLVKSHKPIKRTLFCVPLCSLDTPWDVPSSDPWLTWTLSSHKMIVSKLWKGLHRSDHVPCHQTLAWCCPMDVLAVSMLPLHPAWTSNHWKDRIHSGFAMKKRMGEGLGSSSTKIRHVGTTKTDQLLAHPQSLTILLTHSIHQTVWCDAHLHDGSALKRQTHCHCCDNVWQHANQIFRDIVVVVASPCVVQPSERMDSLWIEGHELVMWDLIKIQPTLWADANGKKKMMDWNWPSHDLVTLVQEKGQWGMLDVLFLITIESFSKSVHDKQIFLCLERNADHRRLVISLQCTAWP